jgi:hypothetical protein
VRALVICLIIGGFFLAVWYGAAIGAEHLGRDGLCPLAWFSAFVSGLFFGLSMVKDNA